MFKTAERDEKKYLKEVLHKLNASFDSIEQRITNYFTGILETKRYIYENLAQLDSAEKAANRIDVHHNIQLGEEAVKEKEKLQKLIKSPYFGRIDFVPDEKSKEQAVYIGTHGFFDVHSGGNIIFDWRAPISSMFYDFELGNANYTAPSGKIKGTIKLKRQYRIRESEFEYMIESSLNIGDEILQKELSQNSDDKMKNIVATILREQNVIIRNEDAKVLLIQGAAGSGKTSIALHRIAFLLYRYKNILKSNNVLIISPSKVFNNYISNVLPELGEENILEMSFEDIAEEMIEKKYKYQTFSQQIEILLGIEKEDMILRIEFKSSNNFVNDLQAYLEYADENYFNPEELDFGVFSISKEELLSRYSSLKRLPIKKRLKKIAENIIEKYKSDTGEKLDGKTSRQIKSEILKLFKFRDSASLYQNFYKHINQENLFRFIGKNTFEFSDVFPFIYVKMYFDGVEHDYKSIKHLLVDEMQDYTPIQYEVLAKLFFCKMTVLGDGNQSVNPYSSSTLEKIRRVFNDCETVELCRSYRSTIEISNFCQRILENKKLIPIERHGEKPNIILCSTEREEIAKLQKQIKEFRKSPYASLGIICKSQKSAKELYKKIYTVDRDVKLLDFNSSEFKEGVVITSVHMAKGLEFDQVIVTDASEQEYKTQIDRSLLYIACTRAMHKLDLICHGNKTKLIDV